MTRGRESFTGIRLQDRDVSLIRDLFESRVMTAAHIAALHFDGSADAAKKRLQKLKAAGLVGERPRKPYEPAILSLTPKGFRQLRTDGRLADHPQFSERSFERRCQVSERTLRHELDVLDVKAAMTRAISATDRFTVATFSTWPLLYQVTIDRFAVDPRTSGDMVVKPDAFLRVHEDEDDQVSEHLFFVEVDRSTESQGVLAAKAPAYLEAYRSGAVAELLGGSRSAFKEYPFRVLFIVQNEERRDSTIERLLSNSPPTLTQVWVSTMTDVFADPLGRVWVRPKDHRQGKSTSVRLVPLSLFQ